MLGIKKILTLIFLIEMLIANIGFSHHSEANSECGNTSTVSSKILSDKVQPFADVNNKQVPMDSQNNQNTDHSCYFHCFASAVFSINEIKIVSIQTQIENNVFFKSLKYKSLHTSPDLQPPIFS